MSSEDKAGVVSISEREIMPQKKELIEDAGPQKQLTLEDLQSLRGMGSHSTNYDDGEEVEMLNVRMKGAKKG